MSDGSVMLDVILAYLLPSMVWLLAVVLGLGLAVLQRGPGICLMAGGSLHLCRLITWAGWQGYTTRRAFEGHEVADVVLLVGQVLHSLALVVAWVFVGLAVLGWRGSRGGLPSAP